MTVKLDQVRIASPCNARWDDMTGNDRARFCGQCQKNVFNFSAITRQEAEALIRQHEGRLCGRFFQRADGSMMTTDCPSRKRRRQNRLARVIGSMTALLLFCLSGCIRREKPIMGKMAPATFNLNETEVTGMIGRPVTNAVDAPIKMGEVASVGTNTPPAQPKTTQP